jgi:hypothetical protein
MYTSFPGERGHRGRSRLARLQRSFSYLFLASLLAGCGASGSEDENATSSSGPSEPIVSLTASPTSVPDNGYSTLTWSAENHYRCEASGGWSGTKGDSGSVTVGPLTVSTVYILACRGIGGITTQAVTVTVGNQAPPPAPTVSLIANPTSVGLNEGTTLSWSSTGATSCEAFDGWSGLKATSGSEAVGPLAATTTFTLVCSGAGGSAGQSVTVTVDAPPPPPTPTVSLSASPASIAYNGSSTLTWISTDATTCSAGGAWSGFKAVNGSQAVGPLTATSTYTLTCTGPGGSAGQSATVTVAAAPLPTVNLSANPTTVNSGGFTTLTWSTSDADSCEARRDWSGSKPLSGSEVVGPLTVDSIFRLRCTGPGGITNVPVTVTVQGSTSNGTADLSWIAPTTNEDGSPLALASFNIYQGTSPSSLQKIDSVAAAQLTYTVNGLATGTHYFAVTAVSDTGAESTFSNVENKDIF